MIELDAFSQAVADALRDLAMERGFSQSLLSQQSGVSQAQISRIFSHKRSVSIEDLSLLAEALGSSASQVVRLAEESLNAERTPTLEVIEDGSSAPDVSEPPLPDFSKLAARTVKSRPQWDAAQQDIHAD